MELYLGLFIPSVLLFLVAIFLQAHKYEATTSSIRLAKECPESPFEIRYLTKTPYEIVINLFT